MAHSTFDLTKSLLLVNAILAFSKIPKAQHDPVLGTIQNKTKRKDDCMKHLNLELEKLEQRIAPGGVSGCSHGSGGGSKGGSGGSKGGSGGSSKSNGSGSHGSKAHGSKAACSK